MSSVFQGVLKVHAGRALTHAEGLFLKLLSEVGAVGYAIYIALQHIPTHLIVEWITKLIWNLQEQNNEKSKLITIF